VATKPSLIDLCRSILGVLLDSLTSQARQNSASAVFRTTWGMLERTAGCLESGSLRRFIPGSKTVNSRRMLHSTFWSHGAIELELSPLWQSLMQVSEVKEPAEDDKTTNAVLSNSGAAVLDFLYPSGALNFIRQCSPWTADGTERRRSKVAFGRLGHRLYTSAAGDSNPRAAITPTVGEEDEIEEQDSKGCKAEISGNYPAASLQDLMGSERPDDYEEAWRQYEFADIVIKQRLTPQLVEYFITSSRRIDAERTVAIFEEIRGSANQTHYEALIKAHLVLHNFDDAAKEHRDALERFQVPLGSDRLLGGLVESRQWDSAYRTWQELKDFQKEHPNIEYNLWTFAVQLPDIADRALEFVAHLRADIEADKTSVRKIATEILTVALFPAQGFTEEKLWSVFKTIEDIGATGPILKPLFEMSIHRVLDMGHTKVAVHLYRHFRRRSDLKVSRLILDKLLQIFCTHHSTLGINQILEDWVRYHSLPSSPTYRMCMTEFASRGDAKTVKSLWSDYVKRQGPRGIRNADDFLPLMHAHAKRGELQSVLQIFREIEEAYGLPRNIKHWNILLNAFGRVHAIDDGFEHYHKLLDSDIRPNSITVATMMGMCIRYGDFKSVYDLYYSAQDMGIRPNSAMVDCLVLSHVQSGNLDKAEKVCVNALRMVLDKGTTRSWNYLLVAYAMRRDLDNVNRIHQYMIDCEVPYDGFTYAALMQALAVGGQPTRAWEILTEVMPQAGIPATEFHYAVVMGGFIKTKEIDKVFTVYRHMLKRPLSIRSGVSTNMEVLKAAAMQDQLLMRNGSSEAARFERAQEYFSEFLMNTDKQDIASNATKGIGRNPIDVAHASAYFEFYIFICGQNKAFDKVKQLYEQFLDHLPDERRSEAPIDMLSALMVSRYNDENFEGVQEVWDFAFRSAKQVWKAKPEANSFVLYSHRFDLCRALSTQIRSLRDQNKWSQLKATVEEVIEEGFQLDSHNWNLYVQGLTRARHYLEAFECCELRLMPGWTGWHKIRLTEPCRNRLSIVQRARKKDPAYLRPIYHTLLFLAKTYIDLEGAREIDGKYSHRLSMIEERCPMTVGAIKTMRRDQDELERTVFSDS